MEAPNSKRNNNNNNNSNNYGYNKKFKGNGNSKQSNPNITIERYETPRYEVTDPEGYKYLEENGFVVFKNVANEEEIKKGIELSWDYLERLLYGLDRNNYKTWNHTNWPDPFGKGIITGDACGHSEFLWHCRGIANIKTIFSTIWETNQLACSFDGFCLHRPFEYNENWKTKEGWYHLDQNGHTKPDKICIQGFLNFFPGGVDDGGLVVIPKSHLIFKEIFREFPHLGKNNDFIRLESLNAFWNGIAKRNNLKPLKVCCQAGDFVLWDSRTIHCNAPAKTNRDIPTDDSILSPRRLVAYVCMTPAIRLTEEVLSARINAYMTGQTTSHWPEECFTPRARKNSKTNYKPPELTEYQKELIPLTAFNVEEKDEKSTI